jgi:hypothetical protein
MKSRFKVRSRDGIETVGYNGVSVNPALCLAINRACSDEKGGTWTVLEYEDELFRVTREEGSKASILIETLS